MAYLTAPDGARLYYDDVGTGTPILCLAGLTRNSSDFDYLAPHLPDVRLIRMDYRGRGKSEWTGLETYTLEVEAGDALALLDHLGLPSAAIIGTSRGGLLAMLIAAIAKPRLTGVCLVDVGPVLAPEGFDTIRNYIGHAPVAESHEDLARKRAALLHGFANVPQARWLEEAQKHYPRTEDGFTLTYDPQLGHVFDALDGPPPAAWPLFDALADLPLALIRGANSDLLSRETAAEMQARRPDMIFADVPDRGHVPFLDEAESLNTLRSWIKKLP